MWFCCTGHHSLHVFYGHLGVISGYFIVSSVCNGFIFNQLLENFSKMNQCFAKHTRIVESPKTPWLGQDVYTFVDFYRF